MFKIVVKPQWQIQGEQSEMRQALPRLRQGALHGRVVLAIDRVPEPIANRRELQAGEHLRQRFHLGFGSLVGTQSGAHAVHQREVQIVEQCAVDVM